MKPLLVGESNPYQTDAEDANRYAFYPEPGNSAGARLCYVVFGMSKYTYLRIFDRINLCHPRWSIRAARSKAVELVSQRGSGDVIVLCGSKVAAAFGLQFAPFSVLRTDGMPRLVMLPHPSGLCRIWHEPDAVPRARAILRDVAILPTE